MNKQIKKPLVPRLRFPEFRDAGEWEDTLFDEIAVFYRGRNISKFNIDPQGNTPCIRYGELYTHYYEIIEQVFSKTELPISELFFSCRNDVLIPSSGETKLDIATASCLMLDGIALDNDINIIRHNQNGKFLSYYLNSCKKIEISNLAQGDTIVHLYSNQLRQIYLNLPEPKEQQKIADCLSSLDESIKANIQKLDALKNHKKGLMQQLFPCEGETIPKLRFPEFQDAGEWEELQLFKISTSIFDGTHQTPTYTEKGIPFFSVENLVSGKQNKFISKKDYLIATINNKPEKGDILITRIGNIGFSSVVEWDYEFSIYVTLAVIKRNILFNSYYLHYFFQSERYQTEIKVKSLLDAVPCKINMDELRKTKVLLPSLKEQQKIADCLSSLDELIAAQSQKIEALKSHKKGLMQQLFPVMDEEE